MLNALLRLLRRKPVPAPKPVVPAPVRTPPPRSAPSRRNRPGVVEATTGPLAALAGKPTLVALDVENLSLSARDLGRAVDYRGLAAALRQGIGAQIHLIAVFSRERDDEESERRLRAAGWATYTRPIEVRRSARGVERDANADIAFAASVGAAAATFRPEALLLGTGDGKLALDIARCVKALIPSCRTVATLSLPEATAHRLDARRSGVIDANAEIGDDVMARLPATAVRRPLVTDPAQVSMR